MSDDRHTWHNRPAPPRPCWRRTDAGTLCGRPGEGPAELCDHHLAQMRDWSGPPTPAPTVPLPETPPAAARVWLDELSDGLDEALRRTA